MSFPCYTQYRASDVEWLGDIPVHWALKPLKAISTSNDDVLDESTQADYEMEYVEISDVDAIEGILGTTQTTFGKAPSRARRRVKNGDVLISSVRTYLRAIAPVINPPNHLIVSTGFAVIRPRTINSRFLGYSLRSEYFIANVIARSVGISYPAVNASELMQIPVPVPEPSEQLDIATFLDRETTKIDALVAEQENLIALLKEKRMAIIAHAVTKGVSPDAPLKESGVEWLGSVPEHWQHVRLGILFRETAESGSDELPVLSVSIHHGVSDKEFDEDELERKVTRSEDRSKYIRVRPGDLVYNMMRAWQGGFGTVKVEGMVSPAYLVGRPRLKICTDFVEYLLRTPQAIEELRRHSHGVTDFRMRLYWDEFKAIKIALPPLEEQRAIREFISSEVAKIAALIAETETAIGLLNERRMALISAAVTGKIDVRGIESANATPKRVAAA